jgi:hypothetical protein
VVLANRGESPHSRPAHALADLLGRRTAAGRAHLVSLHRRCPAPCWVGPPAVCHKRLRGQSGRAHRWTKLNRRRSGPEASRRKWPRSAGDAASGWVGTVGMPSKTRNTCVRAVGATPWCRRSCATHFGSAATTTRRQRARNVVVALPKCVQVRCLKALLSERPRAARLVTTDLMPSAASDGM